MENNIKFIEDSVTNGMVYLKTIRSFCINIQLSFLKQNIEYITVAKIFYKDFVDLTNQLLKYSDGVVSKEIKDNDLLVTKFTLPTYYLTEKLFKIELPIQLIEEQLKLQPGEYIPTPEKVETMLELNRRIIIVSNNFADFLTEIFKLEVAGELYSYSYPFLIRRMVEEINIFVVIMERINQNIPADPTSVLDYEYKTVNLVKSFAIFIRSYTDPSREDIILKAQSFIVELNHLITDYRTVGLSPESQKDLTLKSEKLIERFEIFLEYIIEELLKSEVYLIVEPMFLDNMYHSIKVAKYFLFNIEKELGKTIEG